MANITHISSDRIRIQTWHSSNRFLNSFPYSYALSQDFFFFFKIKWVLKCFPFVTTNLICESGSTPGVGKGNLLQYSCLENPMGYSPCGQRVWHSWVTEHTSTHAIYYYYYSHYIQSTKHCCETSFLFFSFLCKDSKHFRFENFQS